MIQTKNRDCSEKSGDKVRGSLFGGAAGDALGYQIEFMGEKKIRALYGPEGINKYVLDRLSGEALISDDTQMTMFTANGLLIADTNASMTGKPAETGSYMTAAYLDWLGTQEYGGSIESRRDKITWLSDVPKLYYRRAPGGTCLNALMERKKDGCGTGRFLENPINDSKGCGGVMRVAPLGMKQYPNMNIRELDHKGAEIAAITHGHPLGYLPAAVLVHIINRLIYPKNPEKKDTLKEVVLEARNTIAEEFAETDYIEDMTEIIDLAIALSENDKKDIENIHEIGEGWTGDEALAIAVYCALRHKNDFSAGVIAAVNHKGDSDSTGAIAGNILGALIGYDSIEEKWKEKLELKEEILELADDLWTGVRIDAGSGKIDPEWNRKYVLGQRD